MWRRLPRSERHIAATVSPYAASVLDGVWHLLTHSRTYLRIAYLVLAFPLATFYFTVLVTGISLGLGLAIVFVGLAILIVMVLAWRLFGAVERLLAIHLLGAGVRPMSVPEPPAPILIERGRRILADPVTWKSLAYLLVEFPFSIFSFTVTVALLSTAVSLLLVPVAYVVAALVDPSFPADAFQNSGWPGPGFARAERQSSVHARRGQRRPSGLRARLVNAGRGSVFTVKLRREAA